MDGMIDTIREWLATNGLELAKNILLFLVILVVGKIAIGIVLGVVRRALSKSSRISDMLQAFTINVLHKVLWLIVLMMALERLGVNIGPMIAGLGVAGFVIGFAFQETLGNLAAGVMLLINQPFRIGDFVELGGTAGVVKELNMMATTLTTPDNKKVVVPNRSAWGGVITNVTAMDTRRVDLIAGISYSADIGKAIEVLRKIVKDHALTLDDPAATIEVVEMADSSVNLVVRPWVKTADYWAVFFALQRSIKESFDSADIEIPFPQMDVHHHGLPNSAA